MINHNLKIKKTNKMKNKTLFFKNLFVSEEGKEDNEWFHQGTLYLASSFKKNNCQFVICNSKLSLKESQFLTRIKDLDEIFDKNLKIMEPLIIDHFIDDLKEKIVDVKKTSYVRRSGRKYNFRCVVLVGDGRKFVGVGTGKDKDKWQAVRKAARQARLNIIRVKKGCGSWQCNCGTEHSLPTTVEGKCSSVKIKLMPASRGVGLVVADSIKPVFEFVGIKDVWSKTFGSTRTTINFIKATIDALNKTYKN